MTVKFRPARRRLALTALLAAAMLPAAPALAAPSDSAFAVTLTPSVTEVPIGGKVDIEIMYSCTGTSPCTDVILSLPRPAGLPVTSEYVDGWDDPALTGSQDVATGKATSQGDVTFTMVQSIPAGTSGTLSVRYSTLNFVTAGGTPLDVTAHSTGSNVAPQTASTSVLQTAGPATINGRNNEPYPAHVDRDLRFSLGASVSYDKLGAEGIGTLSADLVLPAGAVFVSAETPPTSISEDGLTIRWDDIKPGTSTQYRWMSYEVRFPAASFAPGETPAVTATLGGTSISGQPLTPSASTVSPTLTAFTHVFAPDASISVASGTEGSGLASGSMLTNGQELGTNWYINNVASTVPTTATTILDLPDTYTATRIGRPSDGALVVRWTTASGATGQFTTADYPLAVVSPTPTLTDLGVPAGDRVTRLEIDSPSVSAGGTHNTPALYGIFDAAEGSRVTLASTVRFSADGFADVTRTTSISLYAVAPHPVPHISIQSKNAGTAVRPGEALDWAVTLQSSSIGMMDLEPVVYFPVPQGTRLADVPVTVGATSLSLPAAETTVVHNTSLDQDVLVIRWPGASLANRSSISLTLHTILTSAPAGTLDAAVYGADARGPVGEATYNVDFRNLLPQDSTADEYAPRVRDDRDVDGDGTAGGALARSIATATTGTSVSLRSDLAVRGSLDTDFVTTPERGATASGAPVVYRLPIENTGNVPLTDIVIYDILPFVGDTGVSGAAASLPRGSQFAPRLDGPVTTPDGFEVWYSTSTNPCRPEVFPGQATCDDSWTQTPADITATRAIKLVQTDGEELTGGEKTSATWTMSVTQETPAGSLAVNSAAFSAIRADNSQQIVAEPTFVTVEVAQADLSVRIDESSWLTDTPQPAGIHVTNAGPSDAPAHVTITLPEGIEATVAAAEADGVSAWSCAVDESTVTCDSDGMVTTGTTNELPVAVQPAPALAGAQVEVMAHVDGAYPDIDLTNNDATALIAVTDRNTRPEVDPTHPVVDPTTPAVDPTSPVVDPTSPSVDPTNPTVEPTAPGGSSQTGPVTEGTNGATGTTHQTTDPGSVSQGSALASTGASVAGIVLLGAGLVFGGSVVRRRGSAEPRRTS